MILRNIFDNLQHSADKWDSYFDIYERHLSSFIGKDITLVEIGVQKGGSLEMWSKYLGPQSRIIGIDIDPECLSLTYEQSNIKIAIGDQGNDLFWNEFFKICPKIDILIDDGGHYMNQQVLSLDRVFPILSNPGVYICEDCHSSYMNLYVDNMNCDTTFINYTKDYIDMLHDRWHGQKSCTDLTSIHYYDSVVVFEKFGKKEMNRVRPKLL